MELKYVTLDAAAAATKRIPYTDSDLQILLAYLKNSQARHLDIELQPVMSSEADVKEFLEEGIIFLRSLDLSQDFVFFKLDGGTGFFGRQKSRFLAYLQDFSNREMTPGATFGSLLMALTSINNIYRGCGML